MRRVLKVILPIAAGIIAVGCATTPNDELADKIGTRQFEQLCSQCHSLDRVYAAHRDLNKKQMRDVVLRMSRKEKSGIQADIIDRIVNEMY